MKIQHYAIIFIIIILPFSIICKSRINNKIDVLNNETRINNALDTATMDAIDTLIDLNNEYYGMYEGQTIDITPTIAKEGIKTFFQSLSLNNNLPFIAGSNGDKFAENYFSSYIPAIVVVAYDGFYVYSIEDKPDGTFGYVLSPKIPYAYQSGNYYINFSLGNYIKLYTPDGKLYEGEFKYDYINGIEVQNEYTEINGILGTDTLEYLPQLTTDMSLIVYALEQKNPNSVPLFLRTKSGAGTEMLNDYDVYDNEVSDFHKIRRETIIKLIVDTLNEKINNHNRYADMMGITYDFYLPEIDNATWINSVDDVSIMAFVQGIPTGHETYYNSYALGASRIIRTDYIYGTVLGGTHLYHKSDCITLSGKIDEDGFPIPTDNTIEDLFLNKIDAATSGYYPCMECKP